MILNGCSEESLPVVRERLRHVLANDSIEWWGERRSLLVSTGDATPQAGDTAESILERAQKSLDQASQWLTRATGRGKQRIVPELAMFAIIGIVVVFGCIAAGYLMEHGSMRVLLQPAELLIIGGAAVGTVLISNPLHIIKTIIGGIGAVFGRPKFTQQTYVDALKTMYDLLNRARKD